MTKLKLFIALLLCSASIHAQQNSIVISGRVSTVQNRALVGSSVYSEKYKLGTTTNSQGKFNLEVPSLPQFIRFSFVGYETRIEKISPNNRDTIFINVQLKERFEEIAPVEVQSSSIIKVHSKRNSNIVDFEFFEDKIVLLLSEGDSTYIRVITDNDSTVSELSVSNKSEKLFADCHDKILLIRKDSVFPIRIFTSLIALKGGYSRETFEKTVVPCKTSTQEYLITIKYGKHNKSLSYFLVEKASQEIKSLHVIYDKKQTTTVTDFYNENLLGYDPSRVASSASTLPELGKIRGDQQNFDYYNLVLAQPIYHPIFNINDSLFVFNHLLDKVFVYSADGSMIKSFPIKYHKNKSWQKLVLKDYSTNESYAVFKHKDRIKLKQVNLKNGTTSNGFVLMKHIFPEKVKVKNGYVYYLYLNDSRSPMNKLYKQTISY